MPLRVNLGLSQKVGLPDYGSLGASCNVEIELDAGLLQNDLDAFHRQVRHAYAACRQAVQDELARHDSPPASNGHRFSHNGSSNSGHARTNGHGNGHVANGSISRNGHAHHRISQKQLEYATQLAGQIKELGTQRLDALTQKMFGKPLAELSSLNGSSLIDVLKEMKGGTLDVDGALNGTAT